MTNICSGEAMQGERPSAMSDRELVARLRELLGEERQVMAAVLVHLGEVEARKLYLPAACSSMHGYCTRVLGMSDDEAFMRIRAARAMRRHPVVGEAVATGQLHLTGVVLMAPHLTDDNAAELVAEASGKGKAEIEVVLARRAPRPDVPPRLERVARQLALAPEPPRPDGRAAKVTPGERGARVAPDERGAEVTPDELGPKVTPLAPERFALQLTISGETREKLLRAQALLRHQVPSGDLAELLDRALDALLDTIEARKLGKTKRPRAGKASRVQEYVSRAARREAVARDGMRCSFVSADGRRCEEIGFVELDHVVRAAPGVLTQIDASRGVAMAADTG
jgi:hypothetical protein